uniref:NADH-ubiquinone oxidoreductase chain 6 n=1 Tax=Bolitoglossa n. sp. RLM-2004 TaxID=291262 RepID=Q644A2_9SALA|nr:NADH dehydrogenase subunit 6 [Bolitoglossa n. sp. RLM-2004]AAU20732.1 NADH dehydrogenase subunit 6 [Bolitoglossa n. sp. RLM-2004]
MIYMSFLAMVGLVVGLIAVSVNPSPYYAAFGLVLSGVCGCWLLADLGVSFLSLVLLLVYLGGMLVVFAYSTCLAAETYPEAWGSWSVLMSVMMYMIGVVVCYLFMGGSFWFSSMFSEINNELNMIVGDCSGVSYMYITGVLFLVISGLVLFLTLFVVLEVTRGVSSGSLRAV